MTESEVKEETKEEAAAKKKEEAAAKRKEKAAKKKEEAAAKKKEKDAKRQDEEKPHMSCSSAYLKYKCDHPGLEFNETDGKFWCYPCNASTSNFNWKAVHEKAKAKGLLVGEPKKK